MRQIRTGQRSPTGLLAWQAPNDPVILTSYGDSLAEDKSYQARRLVESAAYQRLFPGIHVSQNSRAVDHWHLDENIGSMLAVGVRGAVTGHGGLLGIIDDPVENWEQGWSETVSNRIWDWWRTTFRTRIWEHGSIVLIMTRWAVNDLAGRIIEQQGKEWTILRLPALAETQEERDWNNSQLGLPAGLPDPLNRQPEEPLTPKRFSKEAMLQFRRDVHIGWAGQYQGVPVPPEGGLFKREWFRTRRFTDVGGAFRIEDQGKIFHREDCSIFAMLDPATSKKRTSDHTAIGVFAWTPGNLMLVLDMVRERLDLEEIVPRLYDLCLMHGVRWIGIEADGFQQSIVNEARKYHGMPAITALKTEGKSKAARAVPAIYRAQAGQLYLPTASGRAVGWLAGFEERLYRFTGKDGQPDDEADVVCWAAGEMEKFVQKEEPDPIAYGAPYQRGGLNNLNGPGGGSMYMPGQGRGGVYMPR